jgi:multiple sugar transport system permease protein
MFKKGIEQGEPDIAAAIGVILVALVLLLAWVSRRLLERD